MPVGAAWWPRIIESARSRSKGAPPVGVADPRFTDRDDMRKVRRASAIARSSRPRLLLAVHLIRGAALVLASPAAAPSGGPPRDRHLFAIALFLVAWSAQAGPSLAPTAPSRARRSTRSCRRPVGCGRRSGAARRLLEFLRHRRRRGISQSRSPFSPSRFALLARRLRAVVTS